MGKITIYKIFFFSLIFLFFIEGCAKTQEEKELKITDNNISIRIEGMVYPSQQQDVLSLVSGRIQHIYKKVGDRVKKGEKIYSLDKELLTLDIKNKQQEIVSLKQIKKDIVAKIHSLQNPMELHLAGLELQKVALLHSVGYMQDFEVDTYKKNYITALNTQKEKISNQYEKIKTLDIAIKTKKAELQKLKYQLKHSDGYAMIDGFVAKMMVQEGQNINTDTKICTIINLDTVILRAGFATGLYPFIFKNQMVNIDFVTTPPYKIKAPIHSVTPLVDPAFKTMTLSVIVPNQNYILQDGTRALVTINIPKKFQKKVKKYFSDNKKERIIQIQSNI